MKRIFQSVWVAGPRENAVQEHRANAGRFRAGIQLTITVCSQEQSLVFGLCQSVGKVEQHNLLHADPRRAV